MLVRDRLRVDLVDPPDSLNDLHPLGEGDDRGLPLGGCQHLVGHDTRDQVVAVRPGATQDVQMPDVEEVVGSRGITNACHQVPGSTRCQTDAPRLRAISAHLGHLSPFHPDARLDSTESNRKVVACPR